MVGTTVGNGPIRCWTRPVPFRDLCVGLHGHIYALSTDNRFVPYEFRQGTAPHKIKVVQNAFFEEILQYLVKHDLTSVLGLEVVEDDVESGGQMYEFVVADQCTVMVAEQQLKYKNGFQVTGWSVAKGDDGISCFKGGQTHSKSTTGSHQIFTDGKALLDVRSVVELLCQSGIVGLETEAIDGTGARQYTSDKDGIVARCQSSITTR